MIRAERLVADYFNRRDGHSPLTLEDFVRRARRDALTDLLARCHHHPDAPAQTLIQFIHRELQEGQL